MGKLKGKRLLGAAIVAALMLPASQAGAAQTGAAQSVAVKAPAAHVLKVPARPGLRPTAACSPILGLLGLCPTAAGPCPSLLLLLGLCKNPAPTPAPTPDPTPTPAPDPVPVPSGPDADYINPDGSYKLAAGDNPYNLQPLGPRAAGAPILPRVDGHPQVGNDLQAVEQGLMTNQQAAWIAGDSHWTIARRSMQWGIVEATQDNFTFHSSKYDEIYSTLIKAGVRPVWQIQSSPRWAASNTSVCRNNGNWCPGTPPAFSQYDGWKDFVKRVVQRYPLAGGVIIWNEPNFGNYNWNTESGNTANPAQYTELLKAAYTAGHQQNPNMPILGGALGQIIYGNGTTEIDTKSFLDGMLASGAGNYMDALSLHPYPVATDFQYVLKGFTDAQSELNRYGFPNMRLFVDEWGVRVGTDGAPDEAGRSAQMVRFLDDLSTNVTNKQDALPGWDRVDGVSYFVTLSASTSNNTDMNDALNYAWMTEVAGNSAGTTFTPRPVYCAMRARLANPPTAAPAACPPFALTLGGATTTARKTTARKLSRSGQLRRVDLRRRSQWTRLGLLPRKGQTFGARIGKKPLLGGSGGLAAMLLGR